LCACKEHYSGARQQNIANCSSPFWGNPISWHCVGDILSEEKKWENETCKNVKMLKGAKLKRPGGCVRLMGCVNGKNGRATDKVIKQ
jgi:hypothetical protein